MKPLVRFVATPFLPEHQPALGVSLLSAALRRSGIPADVRYLNLSYGRAIGWETYRYLSDALPTELLIGEMVFAPALWGERARPWDDYVAALWNWQRSHRLRRADLDERLDQVRQLAANSVAIVEAWADEIVADGPRIVGFTSTFQQNVSSLALAQAIRRRVPRERMAILFGGANCEADMGAALAENFPFIDTVVSGEADEVIVGLVQAILDGRTPPRVLTPAMVAQLDRLPEPDFDEYFQAIRGEAWESSANLAAEASRGCWWGAKSHCTFCGLNGAQMAFRAKSAPRIVAELRSLQTRYGRSEFMMTDNILDLGYLRTVFPELVASDDAATFFFEVKSNLRKEQLELLAAGRVVRLQPGIESLSTAVLKLMAKGTTRLQNLQLLKWCEELGIAVTWNFLYGFPGESADEYARMAELMPLLVHLPAPTGSGKIRLDRFSPYWRAPQDYGLRDMRHFWAYDWAYSGLPEPERSRVAYFFDGAYGDGRDPDGYARDCLEAVTSWRARYFQQKATLEIEEGRRVIDSRNGQSIVTLIDPHERAVLALLDGGRERTQLRAACGFAADECEAVISRCLERGWVIEADGRLLSLVLDRAERQRVVDRRVELQLQSFGLSIADAAPLAAMPL